MHKIFGLGLLFLAGCKTSTTLVGVCPAPVVVERGQTYQVRAGVLGPASPRKADINLRVAQETNSDFLGIYYRPYKIFSVISYPGTFEEAKKHLETLDYVNEIQQLSAKAKYETVDQIVVNFAHSPLPNGKLLGHEIIESISYKNDTISAGFIVLRVKGPITADLIGNLSNMPGVRFLEPNYTYSIPENN